MLKFENCDYGYFGKCLKVTNESMEMLVTVDKGPRIISYHCAGMENIMCEDVNENSTMSGGKFAEVFGDRKWYIYGGHRLWFSPEHDPKSYYPDNEPVDVEITDNTVTLTPPPQTETGFAFSMVLKFDEVKSDVEVTHIIKSIDDSEQEISAWAMTVVDVNSVAILPQSVKPTGLLPNRTYTVWPYSDLQDDRLFMGNKYVTIKQSEDCKANFKLGYNNDNGWLAMANKGQMFVKKFDCDENDKYPDNGCNCECFTNFFMMEIESLSPLKRLSRGQEIVHTEKWSISKRNIDFNRRDEQSVTELIDKSII